MYTGPGQLGARTAYKQVENIWRNWSNPLSKRRMKSLQGGRKIGSDGHLDMREPAEKTPFTNLTAVGQTV